MSYLLKAKNQLKFLLLTENDFSVTLNLVKDKKTATHFDTRDQATQYSKNINEAAKQQMQDISENPYDNSSLDIESIADFLILIPCEDDK